MAEWSAEIWLSAFQKKPKVLQSDSLDAVELVSDVEAYIEAEEGIPGSSYARILHVGGDGLCHHLVHYEEDETVSITNTQHALWPIWEVDEGGPSGGNGGEPVIPRLFGRFFNGKRWSKTGIGDRENMQRMRASFGFIDEDEARIYGDNHKRARPELIRCVWSVGPGSDEAVFQVTFPRDVVVEQHPRRTIARIELDK